MPESAVRRHPTKQCRSRSSVCTSLPYCRACRSPSSHSPASCIGCAAARASAGCHVSALPAWPCCCCARTGLPVAATASPASCRAEAVPPRHSCRQRRTSAPALWRCRILREPARAQRTTQARKQRGSRRWAQAWRAAPSSVAWRVCGAAEGRAVRHHSGPQAAATAAAAAVCV